MMPRTRSTRTQAPQVEGYATATSVIEEAHTTNSNTKGESRIMAMTAEQIQALLSGTRRKGEYLDYLNEFLASGEAGVCANEQWISLKDKKATTISQGFKNAKDNKAAAAGSESVSVLTSDEKVYLINLKVAGVEVPETEAEPAAA